MTNVLFRKVISCLINQLYQIETSDDELINNDFSVSLMEAVGAEFQTLTSDDSSELIKLISEIAVCEKDDALRDYLENFAYNFGLNEEID